MKKKSNGLVAYFKKARGHARPIYVDEVLALAGGNRTICAQLIDGCEQWPRERFAREIIGNIIKNDEARVLSEEKRRWLRRLDEDQATRFLRFVSRQPAPAQPGQAA